MARRTTRGSAGSAPSTTTGVDFGAMKVADLRKALSTRGLDSLGRKAELVERLQAHEAKIAKPTRASRARASASSAKKPAARAGKRVRSAAPSGTGPPKPKKTKTKASSASAASKSSSSASGKASPAASAAAPTTAASAGAAEVGAAQGGGNGKVEIVFSFDTTGSMYPCLSQVRTTIQSTVQRLLAEVPGIRIGLIAHGDYQDEGSTYVIKKFDFSTDVAALCHWVQTVGATCGYDADECYELVLRDARSSDFSWSPDCAYKSLVVIGDANPHGPNDRNNPFKLDWRKEAQALKADGIKVYGVHALGWGHSEAFYRAIANITDGFYLKLNQFSAIEDLILAVCFRENSRNQLEQYEQEMRAGGRLDRARSFMLNTLLGRTADPASADPPGDLNAVAPGRFQVFDVDSDAKVSIKAFVASRGITFKKGRGFYEFTKAEVIQDYKEIVLMDKTTGDMFSGSKARELIGLPVGGSGKSRIRPSDLDYRVFVQSTSVNRMLMPHTGFLYEVDES